MDIDLLGVYIPPLGSKYYKKYTISCYDELSKYMEQLHFKKLLLGDFNGRIGLLQDYEEPI